VEKIIINKIIMGTIIMGLLIIILAVGLYIFDHTKAGKKFFGKEEKTEK
jgi:uncharacterized integral membrane protein